MRVVCLVPSLTETLLHCGVNVVGRTRFCVHPSDQVGSIAVVGGTKGVDWGKISALNPELIVFDKEENLKSMAEASPYPWFATHITCVDDVAQNFHELADLLASPLLHKHADEWQKLSHRPALAHCDWQNLPGKLMELVSSGDHAKICRVEYMIWRDPWMAVGQNTFIASVLQKLGFNDYLVNHVESYPVLHDSEIPRADTFYLFSSEPYPFLRHREVLQSMNLQGAIVDGEFFSWFGIRSYTAISAVLNSTQ